MKRLTRFPQYEYDPIMGTVRNAQRGTYIRGECIQGIPVKRLIYESFHNIQSDEVVIGTRPYTLKNLGTRKKKRNPFLSKRTQNLCAFKDGDNTIYARSYCEMGDFLGYSHGDVKEMLNNSTSQLKRVESLPPGCKRAKHHLLEKGEILHVDDYVNRNR